MPQNCFTTTTREPNLNLQRGNHHWTFSLCPEPAAQLWPATKSSCCDLGCGPGAAAVTSAVLQEAEGGCQPQPEGQEGLLTPADLG